ncbi:extracellular solute-binding protein [Paenibacillus glycanilyticus]|uniref:ABC transporter substrate-binding protein n=1 Tax=Paenibacillus glycanilyticus TaxID=126569 RepID=A0ABQ6GGI2_9BACL|nr:extracellular solute-binding protein [Paenibacillus glycanilyticus]GLX68448.1 hypothetical protein MU1_27930 [Paenibacillus glycanilyticus]
MQRKRMKRVKWIAPLVVASLMLVTACSNNSNKESSPNSSPSDSATNAPADTGPLSKYDPPITLTSVKDEAAKSFLPEGDTVDNNSWTRGYEDELGIKVTYNWIVPAANFGDKMNVTLAGGDLPDLMTVNGTQLKQLIEADKVEDLTSVYETYASPLLKSMVEADNKLGMKAVTFDDKLYAIANYTGVLDSAPMIWIRQDWMKKLNLEAPKTMQDVIAIANAFTKNDPDGDGKNNTYGFVISKGLYQDGMLQPTAFFNGYHAQLGSWVKDASGKYVYSTIQPQVKEALAQLQQFYKEGIIDPEFGTKDVDKALETVNNSKAGMIFGPMYAPFNLGEVIKTNKEADWVPYPVVSIDGEKAYAQTPAPNSNAYVVRKGYEHPEALIKLLNFQVEKMYGESSATERKKYTGESDQAWHAAVVSVLPPNKNVKAQVNVSEALKANDPSKLNTEEKGYYEGILKYRAGDMTQWWNERIFGPESSQGVLKYYMDNNLTIANDYIFANTKTMDTKKATLDKLELETFTKIIYGAESIDAFDKFVENWKKLGGDQITQEVNDTLKP